MLNIKNVSGKIHIGDFIAFLRDEVFIGYGKVVQVLDDTILIDEDSLVRDELQRIDISNGSLNIEIDI